MGLKTAGVGHFTIPTAPAAGTSCTSGAANVFTTTYVQMIASTVAASYITGLYVEEAAISAATYIAVQIATGGAGSETIVGQYLVAPVTGSTVTRCYRPIYPPIPVAISTRIAVKTADSVGAAAKLITLEMITQANVIDDGIAVGTVTTVTNQLTAAAIATGVWQDATAGDFTTASSIGKALFISNIAPGAAGGHMISGSNAGTTTLGALTVTGATTLTGNVAAQAGVNITQTTANADALVITGNGSGNGINTTGGAAVTTTAGGVGIKSTGGASSTSAGGVAGVGLLITGGAGSASTNGAVDGAVFAAGGTNTVASTVHGIKATGASTGHGILATSGAGATGDGIKAVAASTNGNGATFVKVGTGQDFNATSTPLTLAKTTNLTGLNDIAAPTGFAAATFPSGTVANTTNITAATGIDITKILGTAISTPATAGILDVNVKNMNNVAGTSITTIKAVQGLTTADTIATYTGNTKQTADVAAGVNTTQLAGQAVTAAAGVTFPTSVASPTNITSADGINITKVLGTSITADTPGLMNVNGKRINNFAFPT